MRTDRFVFILGLGSGYYNDDKDLITIEVLNQRWKAFAEQRFAYNGIFVAAISEKCYSIYPSGDEPTVRFSGIRQPERTSNEMKYFWIEAVSWICEQMQQFFKTEARIEFDEIEVDIRYLG